LDVVQHYARLHSDRVVDRVDPTDRPEAAERQHELAARPVRHRTAAEACVPALRHHCNPFAVAEPHGGGDLGRVGRSQDGGGCAAVRAAPVDEVRRDVGGVGDEAGRADGRLQRVQEPAGDRAGHQRLLCAIT
jgi:hypothetical protein